MFDLRLIRGTLLISGTTIGAGMLALPVLTGQLGLIPSLILYFCCWVVMASTGMFILEMSLWFDDEPNLLSLAERTLGRVAKFFTISLYFFLFYTLMTAYVAGIGELLGTVLPFSPTVLKTAGLLATFPFLLKGASAIGQINGWFVTILFCSYTLFVLTGISYVNPSQWQHVSWGQFFPSLPIALTAFSYQGTLPSVIHYLEKDVKKIRFAIVFGTFIPLLIYVLWQLVVVGIVPLNGPYSLQEAFNAGESAIGPLSYWIKAPHLDILGWTFAFSALLTSYLGVALGLTDFLSDAFKGSRFVLLLGVLGPPFLINLTYPGLFLKALDLAGGIGCAILLGLFPIIMVWKGRRQRNQPFTLPSSLLLILLSIFLAGVVGSEIYKFF